MPHTKRKGKIVTSTPVVNENQPLISDLFVRAFELTPGEDAAGILAQEQGLNSLAYETSLSPGAPSTPEPPTGKGGGDFIFEESNLNLVSSLVDQKGVKDIDSPQLKSDFLVIKDQVREPCTETSAKEKGVEGNKEGMMSNVSVTTSTKFTLEGIGNMIFTMQKSINDLTSLVQETLSNNKVLQVKIEKLDGVVEKLGNKTGELEKVQCNLIKSEKIHSDKIEQLENQLRRANLRILNFPKTHLLSPKELFKSYLKNILKFTDLTIPIISRIYYITQKEKVELQVKDQVVQNEDIDLSELLEKSSELQINTQSTLIVSFADISQRDSILRLYFRHQNSNFHGQPIRVFPDVAYNTQLRRKEFLTLRDKAITRGDKFILRFPCQCILTHQNTRYVFNQPEQLRVFLDS